MGPGTSMAEAAKQRPEMRLEALWPCHEEPLIHWEPLHVAKTAREPLVHAMSLMALRVEVQSLVGRSPFNPVVGRPWFLLVHADPGEVLSRTTCQVPSHI